MQATSWCFIYWIVEKVHRNIYVSLLLFPKPSHGGSVAERLERWTCNSDAPSSWPTLTASWICSR